MYHHHHQNHQQHPGKNSLPSSRISIPPQKHLFLQSGNGHGDTGLVLSTDAKPRLKWTPELHERFIEAVHQLGGAEKATPKTIMKFMGVPGLTLYHLKSHLQKYRLSKNLHGHANTGIDKNGYTTAVAGDRMSEVSGALMSDSSSVSHISKGLQLNEALQMQIEVQRRLHEQLEVQRHLQLRIEAQGKYLQSVLEKAQETLGKQNQGSMGLEAAKVQLSELVSKVSTECLSSAFSGLNELPTLCIQPTQTSQPTDCSMDSCLTSCEGSQKDREMHNIGMALGPCQGNTSLTHKEESTFARTERTWYEDLNENKLFPSAMQRETERRMFPIKSSNELSMSIRVQGENCGGEISIPGAKPKERDADDKFLKQANKTRAAVEVDTEKIPEEFKPHYLTETLDLNSYDINDAASACKQFDLNGFSWSREEALSKTDCYLKK